MGVHGANIELLQMTVKVRYVAASIMAGRRALGQAIADAAATSGRGDIEAGQDHSPATCALAVQSPPPFSRRNEVAAAEVRRRLVAHRRAARVGLVDFAAGRSRSFSAAMMLRSHLAGRADKVLAGRLSDATSLYGPAIGDGRSGFRPDPVLARTVVLVVCGSDHL
jgi:hypothetical protein